LQKNLNRLSLALVAVFVKFSFQRTIFPDKMTVEKLLNYRAFATNQQIATKYFKKTIAMIPTFDNLRAPRRP